LERGNPVCFRSHFQLLKPVIDGWNLGVVVIVGQFRNICGIPHRWTMIVDVWVTAALSDEKEAKRFIDAIPKHHPFEIRYDKIENVDWESCSRVLDSASRLATLRKGC
jgi:hypothetical protein